MSFTFALSGESSVLNYNFNPPIYLDDEVDYEIGLTNFDTYNIIPNIDNSNNKFAWRGNNEHIVEIPEGCYEIDDILKIMTNKIVQEDDDIFKIMTNETVQEDEDGVLKTNIDINTSKISIKSNRVINFNVKDSIGPVLGFKKRELSANITNISDNPVKVSKVNAICIDCNIAVGSFFNGKPVHIIHQFYPTVPIGYKIVESPLNIIYFPVSVKTINNITIKVIDQEGHLVNFQKETITVRLHLRKSIR